MSKRRAFTLVELLVVIGIIAILVALLLPTLTKAREQAKAVTCQSQVRQLTLGVIMYTQANKDYFPFGSYGGPPTPPIEERYWFTIIQKYFGRQLKWGSGHEIKFWICPNDPWRGGQDAVGTPLLWNATDIQVFREVPRSYGLNRNTAGGTAALPIKTSRVKRGAEFLVVADFKAWASMAPSPTRTVTDHIHHTLRGWPFTALYEAKWGDYHPAQGTRVLNVGYLDGHVAQRTKAQLRIDGENRREWFANNKPD